MLEEWHLLLVQVARATLFNIMASEDQEYHGKVIHDGYVEVIEQDICLFEAMSVYANLALVKSDQEKIMKLFNGIKLRDERWL